MRLVGLCLPSLHPHLPRYPINTDKQGYQAQALPCATWIQKGSRRDPSYNCIDARYVEAAVKHRLAQVLLQPCFEIA